MKNFFASGENKKVAIYIAVFLVILAILVIVFLRSFTGVQKPEIIEPFSETTDQDSEIQNQIKELEELRNQNKNPNPKDIETQVEELKALRQNSQPLTQTQIDEQKRELEKLRLKQ